MCRLNPQALPPSFSECASLKIKDDHSEGGWGSVVNLDTCGLKFKIVN